jgi:hypothetical protein
VLLLLLLLLLPASSCRRCRHGRRLLAQQLCEQVLVEQRMLRPAGYLLHVRKARHQARQPCRHERAECGVVQIWQHAAHAPRDAPIIPTLRR